MSKHLQDDTTIVAVSSGEIDHAIFMIRGHKVMLDRDLARLYEVGTKVLNKAVKRHIDRFPADFMFQLSKEEYSL